MPKALENILKKEYGKRNPAAVYGTMNKIGAMKGNKITTKGKAIEKKHAGTKVEEKKETKKHEKLEGKKEKVEHKLYKRVK